MFDGSNAPKSIILNGFSDNNGADEGKLTISGGTFIGSETVMEMSGADNIGTIVITGGTFPDNVSSYCKDNYDCIQNGDVYVVGKITEDGMIYDGTSIVDAEDGKADIKVESNKTGLTNVQIVTNPNSSKIVVDISAVGDSEINSMMDQTSSILGNIEYADSFGITINEGVGFTAKFTVEVSIPAGFVPFVVTTNNGDIQIIEDVQYDGSFLTFTVDHTTDFIIAYCLDKSNQPVPDDESVPPFIPSGSSSSDDTTYLIAACAAAAVVVLLAVVLVMMERKK